jgi:hypothetical protein
MPAKKSHPAKRATIPSAPPMQPADIHTANANNGEPPAHQSPAPNAPTPSATTPSATTPSAATPSATAPNAAAPSATAPNAAAPSATAPNAGAPNAAALNAIAPRTSEAAAVGASALQSALLALQEELDAERLAHHAARVALERQVSTFEAQLTELRAELAGAAARTRDLEAQLQRIRGAR